MNKREQQKLKDAQDQLQYAKSLRWSPKAEKPDVPPPETGPEHTSGWDILGSGVYARVVKAWSTSSTHGWDSYSPQSKISGSQGRKWLYSTKGRALAAMRNELEDLFSRYLAAIDSEL